MTPAFRHMGGKARLRKWLVSNFPTGGRIYCEPFAGKGNVFFEAKQRLNFRIWTLCDIDTRFLVSVRLAELDLLPESVSKEEFAFWKGSNGFIASLIEPRITFAGKGYLAGYSGSSGTHVGYSGESYRKVCLAARELLNGATISQQDWKLTLTSPELGPKDFVYLDPPYLWTKANYPNINHEELVECLNSASYQWALSGYDNKIYEDCLRYRSKVFMERNSEIKSSNCGGFQGVTETLWMK